MSNTGFTLLWSKTLDSSLWINESKDTKLLFITMLMMKNADGVIQASVPGLSHRSGLTVGEVEVSLAKLLSKDDYDSSGVEGGIRIRKVPGGWQVVNHDLYRFSTEAKRAFWKAQKAEQRAKTPKVAGEKPKRKVTRMGNASVNAAARKYEQEIANGASEEELDKIVTESLPPELREEPPEYRVLNPTGTVDWKPVELGAGQIIDHPPETGKVMVQDGTATCERCGEVGHAGVDCPIPMHLEGGKWVRD